MVYEWKPGARIKASAKTAGEICQRLEREGRLCAKGLLDESRPVDAPLHGEFEWNDGLAAENWREQQARHIINSILVVHEKAEPVRGFFKIESCGNRYESVQTIISSKEKTEELFSTALKELRQIERKYRAIERLASVWEAIGSVEETMKEVI